MPESPENVMMKRGVDHINKSQPPLDFSFRNIDLIEELIEIDEVVVQPRFYVLAQPSICKEVERSWYRRMDALQAYLRHQEHLRLEGQKPLPRLDLWKHIEAGTVDQILGKKGALGGRQGSEEEEKKDVELPRIPATFFRLNNNNIDSIEGFDRVTRLLLLEPSKLTWLDLSFNKMRYISAEICAFKQLKSLYFHGNGVADISEVEKLEQLKELITLTLHGNPLHGLDNYQSFVICNVPWIKALDFVAVTPEMQEKAIRYDRVVGRNKIKSHGKTLHQLEEKLLQMQKKE